MDNFQVGDIVSVKDKFVKNGVIIKIMDQNEAKYLIVDFGDGELSYVKIASDIATKIFKKHKNDLQKDKEHVEYGYINLSDIKFNIENRTNTIKAKWLDSSNGKTCSNCDGEIDIYYHRIDIDDFKYCPYCGAKMR